MLRATKTQLVSASLADVARRVPGRKKSEKNPGEKASFLPRVFFAFQTVLRTVPPAQSAGSPGTVVGVKVSSCSPQLLRRQTQVSLILSMSVRRRRTKALQFVELHAATRACRRQERGALDSKKESYPRTPVPFSHPFPSHKSAWRMRPKRFNSASHTMYQVLSAWPTISRCSVSSSGKIYSSPWLPSQRTAHKA